jgi:DNA-binding winged helix-turn-helix (wHTH) protein
MSIPLPRKHFLEFGEFRLDPDGPLLLRSGERVPLTPKTLDVLVVLVGRRGSLVTKEELVSTVWPDTFVEESNLTHHISVLRKTLGSFEDGHEYIETIPKRGYRFAGPVREGPEARLPDAGPRLVRQMETAEDQPVAHVSGKPVGYLAAAAALILLAALALAVFLSRKPQVESREIQFSVTAPAGATFAPSPPAISPDGTRLAYVVTSEGRSQLYIRALDSVTAQPLPGTDGAAHPFWSPDGRFIGFFAQQKLKKIDVRGGVVETLCQTGFAFGGTWNRDGVILFARTTHPLQRVSALGGTPLPLTSPEESGATHWAFWWPFFLPDGHHFLYYARARSSGDSGIYVGDLAAPDGLVVKQANRLVSTNAGAVYMVSGNGGAGYLLFMREGTLMAQSLDPNAVTLRGDPFPVVEQMGGADTSSLPRFSASATGVLVYRASGAGLTTRLAWFDRGGGELGSVEAADEFAHPALSPDGRRLAVELPDPKSGQPQIWTLDLSRGANSRLTFNSASNKSPVWSADGKRVIFGSQGNGAYKIMQTQADGTGKEELLFQSANWLLPTDILQDRLLVYHEQDPKMRWDLSLLPLTGDRKQAPFLHSRFSESHGQFSPYGRWMAYESDESGSRVTWRAL